jgi:hypothetical protein
LAGTAFPHVILKKFYDFQPHTTVGPNFFGTFRTFRTFRGSPKENSDPIKRRILFIFYIVFLTGFPTGQTTGAEKCKNMVKIKEK